MGPENNIGLEGCWIMECLLPYLSKVTVPHIMVGLERMLDYRGVGLERFHCISLVTRLFSQFTLNLDLSCNLYIKGNEFDRYSS